jgi:hypothetical protein
MNSIKIILSILVSTIAFSCSNSNEDEAVLKVDYQIAIGSFKDLTINTDNHVYALSVMSIPNSDTQKLELNKIGPDGTSTTLYDEDYSILNTPKITHDSFGKIYWTDSQQGKIFSFTENQAPYPVYTIQGATQQENSQLFEFSNLNDNTFAFYDAKLNNFKLFSQSQQTDFVAAGSGNYGVQDGNGLDASFIWITGMKTFNNAIYTINNYQYIRKIDCNSATYNVSTVCNFANQGTILDLAVDADEVIYALVQGKGICKLTNGELTLYKGGIEDITSANAVTTSKIDWTNFREIFIKNNDLYLVGGTNYFDLTLTKISNFKEKL